MFVGFVFICSIRQFTDVMCHVRCHISAMSLHLLLSNTFKFVWLSNLSMFSVLGERYSKMTFYTLNIRLLLHNIYVKNTAFYEGIREPQIVVKRNLTWPTTDNGSTDTKLDHNSPICVRVYLHVYIYIYVFVIIIICFCCITRQMYHHLTSYLFSAKEYIYVKSFHQRLPVPVIRVGIMIVNN